VQQTHSNAGVSPSQSDVSEISTSSLNWHIPDGIVPPREFPTKCKTCKFHKLDNSEGIVPVNLLKKNTSVSSDVRVPS